MSNFLTKISTPFGLGMCPHLGQQFDYFFAHLTFGHLLTRQTALQSIQALIDFTCNCVSRVNIFERLGKRCPLEWMHFIFNTEAVWFGYLVQSGLINQGFDSHLLQKNNRLAAKVFIIIVMAQQTAQYFNRFYHLLLKQHLKDPALHSEWLYFQSMFKNEPLDGNRVELYLGILTNEKNKKVGLNNHNNITEIQVQNASYKNKPNHKYSNDTPPIGNDLKFEKRLSENWKPQLTSFEFKLTPEPLHLRKISCVDEEVNRYPRQSLQSDSKSYKNKKQDQSFTSQNSHSSNINNYLNSLGLNPITSEIKEEKEAKNNERQRKLSQLSGKMVKLFQNHPKLRA